MNEEHTILIHPCSIADGEAAREILQEYITTLEEGLCLQGFDEELAQLHSMYAPPRGTLMLAWVDELLAGCCALRPLDDSDHMGAGEMKRLYVRPAFRGLGLGKQLAEAVLDFARKQGYECVLLDTLDTMEVARQLYEDLGFYEIEPFYNSPLAGAHYLKVDL